MSGEAPGPVAEPGAGGALPRRRLALLLILLLAAHLRFTGLGWELRHVPHTEESPFVGNVGRMITEGSLDHGYYQYPGLLFYLLYPVQALVSPEDPSGPRAYLAARGLIASFGVASVAAVYLLGASLLGPRAGLVAALLLAVAPLEVETAHRVRPDVVLETFVLLTLAVLLRLGGSLRRDVQVGALLGAATAIKFTGLFLVPPYLVARGLAGGPHLRRVALAALVCCVVFLVCTPYAVIQPGEFLKGAQYQLGAHYTGREAVPSVWAGMLLLLNAVKWSLGPIASFLALVGLGLGVRRWRAWAPLLVFAGAYLAVLSTAELRFPRFVVPILGATCLLVAQAVQTLARRQMALAGLLTLVAVIAPYRSSLRMVEGFTRPSDWDRTLDWVEEHVAAGATILDTGPGRRIGFDRGRVEVLRPDPPTDELARFLATSVDYVLMSPGGGGRWGRRLERLFAIGALRLKRPPPNLRQRFEPVSLRAGDLLASQNPELVGALCDQNPRTTWRTSGRWKAGDWIEARLPAPRLVGRVELALGSRPHPRQLAADLRVLVSVAGQGWRRVHVVEGRPPLQEQVTAFRGASQVLLLGGQQASALRLERTEAGVLPWEVAELRVDALR